MITIKQVSKEDFARWQLLSDALLCEVRNPIANFRRDCRPGLAAWPYTGSSVTKQDAYVPAEEAKQKSREELSHDPTFLGGRFVPGTGFLLLFNDGRSTTGYDGLELEGHIKTKRDLAETYTQATLHRFPAIVRKIGRGGS